MITWIKKRWDNGKMFKKLVPSVFVSIALCFMLLLFAPLEIYLSNTTEFWYDTSILLPFVIKDFFIFLGASLIFFVITYFLGDKIHVFSLYGYFTCLVACYIQGNYMVEGLPPFDGTEVNWALYRKETIINIIAWIVIAAIILTVLCVFKADKFKKVVTFASVFLLLVLGSTLAVLSISGGLFEQKQFVKFTKDDQFEMSKDTNFIILMLDAIDEECFWKIWEQHPEYEAAMADFTFYNNTMSGYAYTEHSLPLIISGEWFENKEPFEDYNLRIFRDSPFFNHLEKEGYTLSLYEDDIKFEVGVMDGEFNNMMYTKSSLWDESLFNKRVLKMVGVKYAPYFLKPYCWFNPEMLKHQEMPTTDEEIFSSSNKAFYEDLKNEEITFVDGKRFKLIHLMGAHVPFKYDQYMNEIDNADYFTCIESSMTVTMAYLDKLKESGVYDNSIIVILSDHGYNIKGDAVDTPQRDENETERQHSILFVKGLNERHDLKISGAPISHEDLIDAYYKLLDGSMSDDCFEYKEGDYRERRYLLYKYLGEDYMTEYIQTGYAGDEDTLIPTGNVFEAK